MFMDFQTGHWSEQTNVPNVDRRWGSALESVFLETGVAVLNTDQPGTLQTLSISSAREELDFTREVMEDLHGSDHSPILLKEVDGILDNGISR